MKPFRRGRDGRMTARFTPAEVELLVLLTAQFEDLLAEVAATGDEPLPGLVLGGSTSVSSDAAIARLLPDAYGDAEAASEFRQLTERGLATRKLANARVVRETAATEVTLDAAGATAWMRCVGDLRLTIAARIGIVDDESVVADDDESQSMFDIYNWLAGVQDSIVRALE